MLNFVVPGKVFIYWLGTEPFLCIADPEFLRKMAAGVLGKSWGKPNVFRNDRKPMFGNGLIMVEGDDWLRHRNVITPAFSPANLKVTISLFPSGVRILFYNTRCLIFLLRNSVKFKCNVCTVYVQHAK